MTPAKRRDLELPDSAPRPWLRSDRPVPRKVVAPLERFLSQEVGSGSLLLAAALAALIWSNVSAESYEDLWTTSVGIELGDLGLQEDLRHLVNDLLMALFFFVVALEVKREFLFGSLRDRATAAVPVAAALGTMVGAALTYLAVNIGGGATEGWAIPIATDIAFALSVLGVAGRRAPPELRAFMLTLAVVDDLGTIAVIAVFFTDGIELAWLAGAAAMVAAIVVIQRVGVRHLVVYVIAAGLLWIAIFESGVHATIAGVIVGFLTPATSFYRRDPAAEVIAEQLTELRERKDIEVSTATMAAVSQVSREAVSPLARMEELLHPWSAYVILPLFALANAGVPMSLEQLGDAFTGQIGIGIVLGLVVGAPIVGFGFAWTLARTSAARLPSGLDWSAIAAVAPLKGIGFTVAIFIALLAFDSPDRQEEAKIAILVGSALSAGIGLTALTVRHRTLAKRGRH